MTPDTPAARLADLLTIPTVSGDAGALSAFRERLAVLYPRTHAVLEREVVGEGALHFRWTGGDASPIVLMAHQDVVPVVGQAWRRDPFGGAVEGGVVYGRGALDDKGPLVAILEAVESLLAEGVVPPGDVHLVLGDDEEVAGTGARGVAALLAERDVRPALILDEGGAVVEGVLPGVAGRLAMIGVTEKGIATVRLVVAGQPGHASVPPRGQATVRLARAVARIGRRPFPARTTPVVAATIGALAPRLPRRAGPIATSAAVRPLLGPLLGRLGGAPAALVRTTVAVTMLDAGTASNVLAAEATAVLNVRVAPGETVEGTARRLRRVVADPDVGVRVEDAHDPSPVSPSAGPAWTRIADAVAAAYPDALPVPYVMVQASDGRHFTGIGPVYRFMPFAISAAQLAAIHGADESLDVAALDAGIAFHRALIAGK